MAQLSYVSFDTAYSIGTTGTINRAFPGGSDPSLGNAAVITHATSIQASLQARSVIVPDAPIDVIALLGTSLIRGDVWAWEGYAGGALVASGGPFTIANDWPLGKPRHVVAVLPRDGSDSPLWIDRFRFLVTWLGTRYFGRVWCGPSIRFGPLTDHGYSYSDSGAKVDRTITGQASFVEMPIRRALSIGSQNITQGDAFDTAQLLPGGQTVPLLRNWRELFDAGYLRRSSRMLLVPNEVEPYCSRMAEYCRLTSDVALRHLQGPKLALSLSTEED